jgi:hypothetical protein
MSAPRINIGPQYGHIIQELGLEAAKIAFHNQDATAAEVALKLWEHYKQAMKALTDAVDTTINSP